MIRNIISSKHTDYSTFIQCDCGREILNFYYYKETTTCEEIICVDYFGYLDKKEDIYKKQFSFTISTLLKFIQDLESTQNLKEFESEYEDRGSYLTLRKNEFKFYTICKYANKKSLKLNRAIWDIAIRPPEILELISELKKLLSTIMEEKYSKEEV